MLMSNDDSATEPYHITKQTTVTHQTLQDHVVQEQLSFDCEIKDTYIVQDGECPKTYVITALVETGWSQKQSNCKSICDASTECVGFFINIDGCYPLSQMCYPTQSSTTGAFTYYKSSTLVNSELVGKETFTSGSIGIYGKGNASNAVDGNVDGDYLNGESCLHTNPGTDPYLVVALEAPYIVKQVIVTNRQDCCDERLDDFRVEVMDSFDNNTGTGTGVKLCYQHTGSAPARELYTCNTPVIGRYLKLSLSGTVKILSICEVELIMEPDNRHILVQGEYTFTEAVEICQSSLNGRPAIIKDTQEYDQIQQYLKRNTERYVNYWVANSTDANYIRRRPEQSNGGALVNVASARSFATCEQSSAISSNYDCNAAIDDISTSTSSWVPLSTDVVGSWIKLKFYREHTIVRIRIMQRMCACSSFKDATVLFSNGNQEKVTLAQREGTTNDDTNGAYWDDFYVNPVKTDYVKVTFDSVYDKQGSGIMEIEAYAVPFGSGFKVRNGKCAGNDLTAVAAKLHECERQCRQRSDCDGFDYDTSTSKCELKSLSCEIPASDPNTLSFVVDEVFGWASGAGFCEGAEMFKVKFSVQMCLALCEQLQECMTVNYNVDVGECSLIHKHPCMLNSTQPTGNLIFFSKWRAAANFTQGVNFLGCFGYDRMDVGPVPFTAITVDKCKNFCRLNQTKFAALQGSNCFCGNSFGKTVESSGCSLMCGQDAYNCGGYIQQAVYSTQDCHHKYDPAGWTYGGTTSETASGKTCQRWDSQSPHSHTWTDKTKFVGQSISHNYCRNPNFLDPSGAWCHTMDPNNATETCGVPACDFAINERKCNYISNYDKKLDKKNFGEHLFVVPSACEMKLGVLCERNYDSCSSNPCQNGGNCSSWENNFACTCVVGFTGILCETNIDECAPVTCQNGGQCEDLVNAYKCVCPSGYTGYHCENNFDNCASKPCENNGTCIDHLGYYTCNCLQGYTDYNCSTAINYCDSYPCQAGNCTNDVTRYTCQCEAGYTGVHCETEINECDSSPCANGGSCYDRVNGFICRCPYGYLGSTCEQTTDECSSSPCKNGAKCVDGHLSYTCQCTSGFTGTHCDQDLDGCANNPCQNDGACVDQPTGYICECLPSFAGKQCEHFIATPGNWSEWTEWSPCALPCGPSSQHKSRECTPKNAYCSGPDTMAKHCNLGACPPRDGNWGEWKTDDPCSVTCGHGFTLARRSCDNPAAAYGGAECTGKNETWRMCSKDPCTLSHNGVKCDKEWSDWSDCSSSCGAGHQTRKRGCGVKDSQGFNHPAGTNLHKRSCNAGACPQHSCLQCSGAVLGAGGLSGCSGAEAACGNPHQHCAYTFTNKGTSVLERRCPETTECKKTVKEIVHNCGDIILTLIEHSEFSVGENTKKWISRHDAMLQAVRAVNGTCTICCEGSGCNDGLLPGQELLVVQSSGPQPSKYVILITALALYSLLINLNV